MKKCSPGILFQKGCVLQRQKPIVVWGEGEDGTEICVELAGKSACTTVKDGNWECELEPMEAARGLTLSISCAGEKTEIMDVCIGEVWIAGGQSNMAFSLCYDAAWEKTKTLPKNPGIRMFNVPRLAYPGHQKDISDSGYWFEEGDAAWELFSAPAYSFARNIQPALGVPVGVIGCNWGGASASVWVDTPYMEQEPLNAYLTEYARAIEGKNPEELKRLEEISYRAEETPERKAAMDEVLTGCSLKEQKEWMEKPAARLPANPMGPYNVGRPGGLYHMMLRKICPYAARGVLWYHGESDCAHDTIYDKLLEALIRCFRDSFRQKLPFLLVQIAPFGKWLWSSGERFPQIRRCQETVSQSVPGVFLTSIMDLGMYEDLHPKRKMEVGRRLALLALGKVYDRNILCECPALLSAKRNDEGISISFSHVGSGLWEAPFEPEKEEEAMQPSALTGPAELKLGFVVSCGGACLEIDRVEVRRDSVQLWMEDLPEEACDIAFAQVPYIKVRIFNAAGLPVKPFCCSV